mmetsp:Transcript_29009/g.55685  ORF Transcript_29009/g.55685 Transcript_29009/m.55685 type:complete len:202 (-) Transcript_29009:3403-4008(-)
MVALRARITSLTSSVATRSVSCGMRNSSGPMASSADNVPPSTWYRPWNDPDRSIAQRSATSSTTQSVPLPRFGDVQMSQISAVPTLPQLRHSRAVAATVCIMSASGVSKSARLRIRCSTARRAERGPRPGSLAIISIRASMSRVLLKRRSRLCGRGVSILGTMKGQVALRTAASCPVAGPNPRSVCPFLPALFRWLWFGRP